MLASALDADLESWPPPLNDEGSLRWTYEKLKANPEQVGFFSWYVVLTNEQRRKLIGPVAFKDPPDNQGMIETGYSVLEKLSNAGDRNRGNVRDLGVGVPESGCAPYCCRDFS